MANEKVDILVFGAHPDDVELAVGGTILKSVDQGLKVVVVDLTEGSLGSRGSVKTRYAEASKASEILGLHKRVNLKMEDGFFVNDADHRKLVIEQIRRFRPSIVLCNAPSDRHPDHGRASILVREACFYAGLKKINSSWDGEKQKAHRPRVVYQYIQDRYLEPDFVVDVAGYEEKKMKAILAYSTQFYDPNSTGPNTPISSPEFLDFLKGRLSEFGRRISSSAGEGFVCERTPGVHSLMTLV